VQHAAAAAAGLTALMPVSLRRFAALALGLACLPAGAQSAPRTRVLDTHRYTVTITIPCPEQQVTCDRVQYRALDERTGGSMSLTGRTEHEKCADGRTPCRFIGYVFARGPYRYFVTEGGELIVYKRKKEVQRELGQWRP